MLAKTKFFFLILLFTLTSCKSTPEPLVISPATETLTPVPLPTDSFTPTITLVAETVVFEESTSPNEEWTGIVTITSRETSKDLLFKITNNRNDQIWIIEQTDVSKDGNPLPGFMYPYIFKWSQDGKYLYYSHLSTFNDGCFGYFSPGGFDLIKFDLSTGNSILLREDKATWMALSPDEKRLAYIDTFGGNVSILDIDSGIAQIYPLPSVKNEDNFVTDTSDLYWSPDGKSLVYAHYIGACDLIVPFSYVIQLFPDDHKQIILIENSDKGYIPIEWNIQDNILLRDSEGKQWRLDPTTKEIKTDSQ